MPLSGFGRFSAPALLILLALSDGPKHGWAISEDVEGLTGKRPGPGTLYGAIGRLEDRGLIRAEQEDGRRRPYTITRSGEKELRMAFEEMSTLARVAQRRLGYRTQGSPA